MKTKSANQKLREKQSLFFSIGLVTALALVITAFEWKQYTEPIIVLPPEGEAFLLPPIASTVQPVPPKPKPTIKNEEVVEAQKAVDVKEAIAEIDRKIFIEEPAIAVVELPELSDEEVNETFFIVEEMPSFEGGSAAFYAHISKHLKYPEKAITRDIEGKVYISFAIDTDGSITDIKVLKGIGFGCDEEAVRVLKNAPKWNPGKQRGKPVKVSMVLPIVFSLPN